MDVAGRINSKIMIIDHTWDNLGALEQRIAGSRGLTADAMQAMYDLISTLRDIQNTRNNMMDLIAAMSSMLTEEQMAAAAVAASLDPGHPLNRL